MNEMKMFKYILSITLMTFVAVSCSEDFLDKAPLDSINTENFYVTEADSYNFV